MAGLSDLTDDQLDFLEKAHKKGMGGLSDDELNRLDSITNPSRMQRLGEAIGGAASRLKPIGVGLAKVPGAIADTLNQTTQIGAEPDLRKGIPEEWKGVNLFDPNATAPLPQKDTSFAGQIGEKIGYQPRDKFDEYLEGAATGGGAALLSPGAALKAIPRMVWGGAVPQVAAKAAGEGAAAAGASPETQKWTALGTGLFAPYAATRARTPLPVKDPQRLAATKTLNEAGVKTTAGQDTNRRWLQSNEAFAFPDRNEQQARQFTNAVTEHLGQPTEAVTIGQGGYLPQVGRDIKRNMDSVAGRNNINLGVMSPQERLDVRSSLEQIARDNPRHVAPILDLIHKNTGWTPNMVGAGSPEEAIWRTVYPGARVIPGQHYQRLRSQLWSEAGDVASSNPTLAESYRETARSLDRAMGHSIGRQNPADANAFQNARQLLENHMIVEKARSHPGGGSDQISPKALESSARQVVGDKRYNAGDTPYQPLATAAQKALPTLKGDNKDWMHNTGLGATAAGAIAGAIAPLAAMKHGSGMNAATEAGIYALLEGGAVGAVPALAGRFLGTRGLGQRYLRNQGLPATPQNAAARQRNAVIQALIASQQSGGK